MRWKQGEFLPSLGETVLFPSFRVFYLIINNFRFFPLTLQYRVFVTFDGNEVNRLFDKYKAVNPNLIELSRTPVLPAGEGCPVWVVLVSATDQREWILATLSKEADPDANEEERWINFHAYLFQKFRTIAIRLAEENIRTDKMIADSQEEAWLDSEHLSLLQLWRHKDLTFLEFCDRTFCFNASRSTRLLGTL